jgi:integrase
MTVNEIWDFYQDFLTSSAKKNNLMTDCSRYKLHLSPSIGQKDISELSAVDFRNLLGSLQEKKLSPQTIHHVLNLARRILNFGKDMNYISEFPSFKKIFPRFDNNRGRYLSELEIDLLLTELDGTDWVDIIIFALNTGLRAGEIYAIKQEHIDLASKFVYVTDTKANRNRTVPLNTDAYAVVKKRILNMRKKQLTRNDFIFKYPPRKQWQQAIKNCRFNEGVTDRRQRVVFHTLRHTFASRLVQSNTPIALVSQLLGHSNMKLTMRYSHFAPDQTRIAVDSLVVHKP